MFGARHVRTSKYPGLRSNQATAVRTCAVPIAHLPTWLRKPKPAQSAVPLEIAPYDRCDALHRAGLEEGYSWPLRWR